MRRACRLAVVVLALTTGCGRGAPPPSVPLAVAVELAPATVASGLTLHEKNDEGTRAAFANAGQDTLIADGRVWEIRDGDRLVATLQITTMGKDVDLADAHARRQIVAQVVSGSVSRVSIEAVEVYTASVDDKVVFVWFGARIFEVLQTKGIDEKAEAIVTDLIRHQQALPAWEPLPITDEVLED